MNFLFHNIRVHLHSVHLSSFFLFDFERSQWSGTVYSPLHKSNFISMLNAYAVSDRILSFDRVR